MDSILLFFLVLAAIVFILRVLRDQAPKAPAYKQRAAPMPRMNVETIYTLEKGEYFEFATSRTLNPGDTILIHRHGQNSYGVAMISTRTPHGSYFAQRIG